MSGSFFRTLCAAAMLQLALSPLCLGAAAADAQLRIERVALFKNGLGHFTSKATLPADADSVRFGQLPVPAHGTFWVLYEQDVPVKGLFTGLEDTTSSEPIQSVADFLEANVGKDVVLRTHNKDEAPIAGKLLSVTRRESPEPPSPYVMSPRPDERNRRGYPANAAIAMVQAEFGVVVIDVNRIGQCLVAGDANRADHKVTSRTPVLRMELARPAGGKAVWVDYLARGMTWAPSYRIDLSDAETARITAKAVVINEIADLVDVKLELVTGFPNMKFADVNSPIALSQALEQFIQSLGRGRSESAGRGRGVVGQQAVMSNTAFWAEAEMPVAGYSTIQQGCQAEDLFLYPVDAVSIRKGETAYLPLFAIEAPYKHVYTWAIPDSLDEQDRYRQNQERDATPEQEEVWHCCRFTNGDKMPLTTAPAEFVKDGQIVGQDICYYTNPGAKTTVRINRAMRIVADQAEFETGRTRNALNFRGSYDLVQVRGELKLRNGLNKPADVEVTKLLSGKVLESTGEPTTTAIAKGLSAVNTRHRLVWKQTLEAGKDMELTYNYEVYVRR